MRVIDGMHRLHAALLRGDDRIGVTFFDGDDDDAFLLALRLNAAHGLPLSQADRSAAAARIVRAHPRWSNRAIALTTGLSDKTVASIRRRSTADIPQLNDRVGRDGRARPVDATIGRVQAGKLISEKPDATLRVIAREAGISLATARDVRERLRLGQDPVPRQLREGRGRRPRPSALLSPGDTADGSRLNTAREALILQNLRNDPGLRYTEAGRAVLRLLAMHSITAQDWSVLIDSVPVHCASAVAQLAYSCAEVWQEFAQTLVAESQRQLAAGS